MRTLEWWLGLFAICSAVVALTGCPAASTPREIHVATNGDDAAPGTAEQPLRTLARAATLARPGDVCVIHAGTYREVLRPKRSGSEGAPIVFRGAPGERVVISAMEPVDTWERESGDIFRTVIDWDLGGENMVAFRGEVCDLARWPNKTDRDPYNLCWTRNTGGSDKTVKSDAWLEYTPGIPEANWADGGSLVFFGDATGCGWLTWRRRIKSATTDRVTFDLPRGWVGDYHAPAAGGEFFLQGVREVLDYPYEWHLDRDGTLRLQLPAGEEPAGGDVQVRRRLRTVDLRGRHHIEVHDLAVYGGMIDLSRGAHDNLLRGVTSVHGNHTSGIARSQHSESRSVFIRGDRNTIERCDIGYGSGSGVWVEGRGNRILNSRIHDFNTLGNYDAPLALRKGSHTLVKGNTIFHGGRDGVQFFHHDSEFAYNDVYRSNLIVHDCAPIYTVGGPFRGEIHHNWFHDVRGRTDKLYKATGIYLDNSPVSFRVHHNVVWNTQWSSIQINLNADDIQIFNNTFWNGSEVNGWWRPKVGEFPRLKEDTRFRDVKQWNNLGYGDHWDPQTDQRNNLSLEGDPFVDFESRDFRPRPGSPAIDAGIEIEGITDGYVGSAPDVGAYEAGAEPWKAGIDWDPEAGPAGHGDYGLLRDG